MRTFSSVCCSPTTLKHNHCPITALRCTLFLAHCFFFSTALIVNPITNKLLGITSKSCYKSTNVIKFQYLPILPTFCNWAFVKHIPVSCTKCICKDFNFGLCCNICMFVFLHSVFFMHSPKKNQNKKPPQNVYYCWKLAFWILFSNLTDIILLPVTLRLCII